MPLQERHAAVATSLFRVGGTGPRSSSASLTRRGLAIEPSAETKQVVAVASKGRWKMGPHFEFWMKPDGTTRIQAGEQKFIFPPN